MAVRTRSPGSGCTRQPNAIAAPCRCARRARTAHPARSARQPLPHRSGGLASRPSAATVVQRDGMGRDGPDRRDVGHGAPPCGCSSLPRRPRQAGERWCQFPAFVRSGSGPSAPDREGIMRVDVGDRMKVGAVERYARQVGAIQNRVTEIGVRQIGAGEVAHRARSGRSRCIGYSVASAKTAPRRIGVDQGWPASDRLPSGPPPPGSHLLSTARASLAPVSRAPARLAPISMHCVRSAPVRSQPLKSAPFNSRSPAPNPGSGSAGEVGANQCGCGRNARHRALPPADRHSGTPLGSTPCRTISMPVVVHFDDGSPLEPDPGEDRAGQVAFHDRRMNSGVRRTAPGSGWS